MADPVVVIQATLAPIFLVNGAAIFLNFVQARLFRVIDRMRALEKEAKEMPEGDERALVLRDRARQVTRAVILRNSILFGVLVIAFTVVSTVILLAAGLRPGLSADTAIYSFGAALLSFAVALGFVTTDSFMSVAHARAGRMALR